MPSTTASTSATPATVVPMPRASAIDSATARIRASASRIAARSPSTVSGGALGRRPAGRRRPRWPAAPRRARPCRRPPRTPGGRATELSWFSARCPVSVAAPHASSTSCTPLTPVDDPLARDNPGRAKTRRSGRGSRRTRSPDAQPRPRGRGAQAGGSGGDARPRCRSGAPAAAAPSAGTPGPPERPSTTPSPGRRRGRPSSPRPSPASARAATPRRWAAAARSPAAATAAPAPRRSARPPRRPPPPRRRRAGRSRSTAAQLPWNTRGSSAASSFAAVPSAACASASSSSSSRWVSSGPANGRSASTSTPGTVLHRGDQAVGQPVRRQVDHDVVHGQTAAALEDVDRDDVDAGRAQRGGDGAEDAGPVGDDQAQEIGHGSSRRRHCWGGRDLRRSRGSSFPHRPRGRRAAPGRVRPPT